MSIQLVYDIKRNISTTRKIVGNTNYYVGITKICGRCRRAIRGYPAVSRRDNVTEICNNCGIIESLEDFKKYEESLKDENKNNN